MHLFIYLDEFQLVHVASLTQQKLTDLSHPSYTSDHSPTHNHFLSSSWHIFKTIETFRSKRDVETAFKNFLASKIQFYRRGMKNIINRWRKYIDDWRGEPQLCNG